MQTTEAIGTLLDPDGRSHIDIPIPLGESSEEEVTLPAGITRTPGAATPRGCMTPPVAPVTPPPATPLDTFPEGLGAALAEDSAVPYSAPSLEETEGAGSNDTSEEALCSGPGPSQKELKDARERK